MSLGRTIFFVTFGLFVFGLLMLSSASSVKGISSFDDSLYFLKKQFIGGLIGIIGFLIAAVLPYNIWRQLALLIFIFCLILLVLVFSPAGLKIGNSSSWINLGFISFQPAELAKIGLIFYLSAWLSSRNKKIETFEEGTVGFIFIVALVGILILFQPDFGTLFIIGSIALGLFFLGGGKFSHFVAMLLVGFFLFLGIISVFPEKAQRLNTFLNYEKDPLGSGYQIKESLISLGSGGLFGKGFGYSSQKWNFLPEPAGDTIFAIIGEELGFIGALVILGTIMFLGLLCLSVGKKSDDFFAKLCAAGVGIMILVQSIINMGGVLNVFPFTGVTLPLISHGSTSLIVTMFSLGVVVNIAKSQKI